MNISGVFQHHKLPSPDNSWISMNPLENRTDQGDPGLSAEVDLYRVLKLLVREK
jgi:hypothetical protein